MKKIIFTALLLTPGILASQGTKLIEVHGHRGTRGTRPENTLSAFREALRLGVDVLEMDMNVTKDGVIVISHEKSIIPDICLGPDGKKLASPAPIISLTLEEVKKYDCGTLQNPRFPAQAPSPGERIPTLEEVFQMVLASTEPAAARVRFNIETKLVPGEPELSPPPAVFAKLFVDMVKKYGLTDRVILQSFDWRTLVEAKKLEPKIKIAQLIEATLVDLVAVAKSSQADIISPEFKWINKDVVEYLHKNGIQVVPWTLNDKKDIENAISWGVDGIITDYPGDLIDYLKAKKLR
ncbi:MAG: glycerophosphodiester phosphodiesterase [Elusimicrobia bacterium]|nr:glycerophosphodiester phosphodiesterase [Elusimicrobiota bacterium]